MLLYIFPVSRSYLNIIVVIVTCEDEPRIRPFSTKMNVLMINSVNICSHTDGISKNVVKSSLVPPAPTTDLPLGQDRYLCLPSGWRTPPQSLMSLEWGASGKKDRSWGEEHAGLLWWSEQLVHAQRPVTWPSWVGSVSRFLMVPHLWGSHDATSHFWDQWV